MAIKRKSLEFIHSILDKEESKTELLDLGNSYIRGDGVDYIKKNYEMGGFTYTDNGYGSKKVNIISKQYFTALGYNHTSIDLNGREDSLMLDLRNPIVDYTEYDLINKFDFILDMGTIEHIDNQYMAFKNIHDMCSVGGIFIHVVPREGYWMGHCKYKYNLKFFEDLASFNDYEILFLEINSERDIFCSIRKTKDGDFVSESNFNKLPLVIEEGGNFNDRELYPYAYG